MFGSKAKQRKILESAKQLKEQGELDEALAALREGYLFEEAALWLAEAGRFREAARLIVHDLDLTPVAVREMDQGQRKRVLMGAVYFGKAGEDDRAVELYLALGEKARADELLAKSGKPPRELETEGGRVPEAERWESAGDLDKALVIYVREKAWAAAGRTARRLGKFQAAAEYYMLAEKPFEAAACWLDADDAEQSLACLLKVPRENERYRAACMHVARVATEYDILTFEVDNFLGPFISMPPADELEMQALYDVGSLYVNNEMYEGARDAYQSIVGVEPGFLDTAALLQAVEQLLRGSGAQLARILDEKRRVRGVAREAARAAVGTAQPNHGGGARISEPGAPSPPVPSGELLSPGRVVADRYLIQDIIGRGGSAVVMRALDQELNDVVALKVVTPLTHDDETVQRFRRELRVTRQLTHRNVIRVHDGGIFEGRRYISMEMLVGQSLDVYLGQPLPVDYGLGYLLQACEGLQEAHNHGIVHRDVKPGNLFLTGEGVIKVMDFGLAHQFDTGSGSLTGKQIIGTPPYMAPEQINHRPVGPQTDIYSLGIVAYEIFTGDVPFMHQELLRLLMMHVTDTPRPPRARNPELPEALERVILKCLAKLPVDRYASCTELAADLRAVSTGAAGPPG